MTALEYSNDISSGTYWNVDLRALIDERKIVRQDISQVDTRDVLAVMRQIKQFEKWTKLI